MTALAQINHLIVTPEQVGLFRENTGLSPHWTPTGRLYPEELTDYIRSLGLPTSDNLSDLQRHGNEYRPIRLYLTRLDLGRDERGRIGLWLRTEDRKCLHYTPHSYEEIHALIRYLRKGTPLLALQGQANDVKDIRPATGPLKAGNDTRAEPVRLLYLEVREKLVWLSFRDQDDSLQERPAFTLPLAEKFQEYGRFLRYKPGLAILLYDKDHFYEIFLPKGTPNPIPPDIPKAPLPKPRQLEFSQTGIHRIRIEPQISTVSLCGDDKPLRLEPSRIDELTGTVYRQFLAGGEARFWWQAANEERLWQID